ncbi:helix-turn-helix transcriptional regulator [Roseibium sp.]|nr:helix-turn-helix transcriptional regulator [Roseibium sp.]
MSNYPHKNARHPVYIWEWRKKHGMTSESLAEASGIQRSLLSQLETGSKRVNVDHLLLLARVFNCHPGDLMRSPEDDFSELSKLFEGIPETEREKALKLLSAFSEDNSKST